MWKHVAPFYTQQVGLTLGLSLLAFAFLRLLHGGFTRSILRLAMLVTLAYLAASGIVVHRCCISGGS